MGSWIQGYASATHTHPIGAPAATIMAKTGDPGTTTQAGVLADSGSASVQASAPLSSGWSVDGVTGDAKPSGALSTTRVVSPSGPASLSQVTALTGLTAGATDTAVKTLPTNTGAPNAGT